MLSLLSGISSVKTGRVITATFPIVPRGRGYWCYRTGFRACKQINVPGCVVGRLFSREFSRVCCGECGFQRV